MKKEYIIAVVVVVISLMCLIAYMGYRCGVASVSQYKTDRDTTTFVDTIPYYKPVPKDSMVVRYVTRVLPVHRENSGDSRDSKDSRDSGYSDYSRDSAAVAVPIIQKRYDGEDYRAYVSGYEPNLDSIFVYPKTTVIHERTYKPPNKWHIGITGGYGYGFKSKQAEPYIGIGITYSIY